MINSLKNNKKLLRRKSRFEQNEGLRYDNKGNATSKENIFKTKKASPELLEKIRKEAKQSRRRWLLFSLLVSVAVIGSISYLVYDYNQDVIKAKVERKKEQKKRYQSYRLESLNESIKNGNDYFKAKKWELAVSAYYDAYNIQPENKSLNYRLIQSMIFCCRDLNAYCDKIEVFIQGFENYFPEETEKIKKLKAYYSEINI